MGKTLKPLKILVHKDYTEAPWVAELRDKGHTVNILSLAGYCGPGEIFDADLILAPQAARFVPGMERWLDSLVKGARKVKYTGKTSDDEA